MQKPISTLSLLKSSIILFILLSCVFVPPSSTSAKPLATITVQAGAYTRIDTPVTAWLDGVALGFPSDEIQLVEIKDSQRIEVPVQLEAGSPPRLWWILKGTTPAGQNRTYELIKAKTTKTNMVKAIKDEKALDLQMGEAKILRYHHGIVPPPENLGRVPEERRPLYNRSGFIHPLWSPHGAVLTEIHPLDHIHHFGLWMPWTHTKYEGKMVDFWNVGDGTGTVRFSKYISTTDGPVYGGFQVEHDHVALKTSKGEQTILKEVWDMRAYNIGGPDKGFWLLDFVSAQRCVAEKPLHQDQYRYGGFGFRGAKEWKGENAAYLTSEGKTRADGHATRARWCDASGKIKEWEGVTFYSHPENFQHPEPMRIWPGFDDNVFFNFVASQATEWEMKPGEDHLFRYRMYVHEGKIDVETTERFWNDYAYPPKVKIKPAPSNAITLFDGKDFKQWTTGSDKKIGWKIIDGAMKVVPKSGSIMTKQSFSDFKLHIEFQTPKMPPNVKGQDRGNSGVYLQRRYEVQILDSYGLEPKDNECGAIYKIKKPDKNVCRMPGRWQSYDIIFHAAKFDGNKKIKNAYITVWHNGVLIHDEVQIPDKTGAGRNEGPEPGPILLQDHGNEVSFRNIWIIPL
jgi:hypothetical protein